MYGRKSGHIGCEASDNYLDGYAYWGRIDRSVAGTLFDPTVWAEPLKGVN